MKILIASPDIKTSRQLNSAVGELAPVATYFHADTAERVLTLMTQHRLNLVLLDLQLLAKDGAASALLRLIHPGGTSVAPLRDAHAAASTERGLLLTFDSREEGVGGVIDCLKGGTCVPRETSKSATTIWGQSESGEWSAIEIPEVKWAVSEAGKVKLQHRSGAVYSVRDPLRELERQLSMAQFVRIHKSYLVNPNFVSEVQRWSSGGLLLAVDDTHLPVSRRYVTHFRKRTGWGVGPVRPRPPAMAAAAV